MATGTITQHEQSCKDHMFIAQPMKQHVCHTLLNTHINHITKGFSGDFDGILQGLSKHSQVIPCESPGILKGSQMDSMGLQARDSHLIYQRILMGSHEILKEILMNCLVLQSGPWDSKGILI